MPLLSGRRTSRVACFAFPFARQKPPLRCATEGRRGAGTVCPATVRLPLCLDIRSPFDVNRSGRLVQRSVAQHLCCFSVLGQNRIRSLRPFSPRQPFSLCTVRILSIIRRPLSSRAGPKRLEKNVPVGRCTELQCMNYMLVKKQQRRLC